MDNLSHTLFAFFIGIVVYYLLKFKTSRRKALIAAVIAGNLPDIDVVVRLISSSLYLEYHRQLTHSIIGIIVAVVVVAYVMRKLTKEKYWKYLVLSFACIVSHVFLDFITAYGTQILFPFNSIRYEISLVPIVDIYVFAIFGVGIAFLHMERDQWSKIAKATLFIFCIFLLFKSGLHFHAVEQVSDLGEYEDVSLVSHLFNPFGWRAIVNEEDHYLITDFDLTVGGYAGFKTYPKLSGPKIDASKESLLVRQFLVFSKYPYAEVNGNVVRWMDMRYSVSDKSPIVAEVELDDELNVVRDNLKAI